MAYCYVTKCIYCNEQYEVDIPIEGNIEDVEQRSGICSEDCLERYKSAWDLPNSYFSKSSIKYLKQLGHHELGDWIVRGGLEELMQKDDE
jgi:hypothetical protein